jgi:hypothetical protein
MPAERKVYQFKVMNEMKQPAGALRTSKREGIYSERSAASDCNGNESNENQKEVYILHVLSLLFRAESVLPANDAIANPASHIAIYGIFSDRT